MVDGTITNNKGKAKQDPRVPPPRKFHPPRGGQHPINIHVNHVPITSRDNDMVAAAPPTHRRQMNKHKFFHHAPLRGSDESRARALVCFSF
jgi:hypothetical protein